MKTLVLLLALSMYIVPLFSQDKTAVNMSYEPSIEYPYGRINPEAPSQLADFEKIIGTCNCRSIKRNQDGTWQDTLNMVWKFKYIMNGYAIQDEVWRENNFYAGSIRQYQPDSAFWVVTYFSYPAISNKPGTWHGNKIGDDIILKMPFKIPSGKDGFSRLTFYDINNEGFKWKGEWIDLDKTILYPFWSIECKKLR